MNVIFALALVALTSTTANADPAQAHLQASAKLIQASGADIKYLNENVEKCTRFGSMIQERMLQPISVDLQMFSQRFASYNPNAKFGCASQKQMDAVVAKISLILAHATQPQSELAGMSGDQAMTKALSWDNDHPDCKMEEAGDAKSTRELKTYFSLKQKLVALRTSAAALKTLAICN